MRELSKMRIAMSKYLYLHHVFQHCFNVAPSFGPGLMMKRAVVFCIALKLMPLEEPVKRPSQLNSLLYTFSPGKYAELLKNVKSSALRCYMNTN